METLKKILAGILLIGFQCMAFALNGDGADNKPALFNFTAVVKNMKVEIHVVDFNGKILYEGSSKVTDSGVLYLEYKLEKGSYFLVAETDSGRSIVKTMEIY